jgi:hypothetical protein
MAFDFAAGAVTDQHLVAVLRPFVRATRPVLAALREADPFGLRQRALTGTPADDFERSLRDKVLDRISTVKLPGTPAWSAMGPEQRCHWWVNRVGRFTALLAAVPGVGGVLADRLPVQDALGSAAQGLLLAAIAGEYGVTDEDTQIRMLAKVLFRRDVGAGPVRAVATDGVDQQAAELTAELAESKQKKGRVTLRAVAATVWRMGRVLWALGDELGKRPQGRWYHKAIGMLPVVGVVGDYFAERTALRRAARAAQRWLAANARVA